MAVYCHASVACSDVTAIAIFVFVSQAKCSYRVINTEAGTMGAMGGGS